MKTLFIALLAVVFLTSLAGAQPKPKPKPLAAPKAAPRAAATTTCVQADLTHPDSTTASWTAGGGQTGYVLERKLGSTGTYAQIAIPAGTATSYTDSTIVRDPVNVNEYFYRIKATGSNNTQSAYAPEQCIDFAAKPTGPGVPSGFTLSALSTEEVQASWAGDNTGTVTGYSLTVASYTPSNTYGPFVTQPPTTSYVVGGLQKNKTYCGTMFQSVGTTNSPSTPQACATTRAK